MKKLNLCRTEITDTYIYQQNEDFSTLDGFVYEVENGSFSYDNNFDESLPTLLIGVRNPDSNERQTSYEKKFYLPKKLQNIRQKPLEFWMNGENHLSEILSFYPQISASIKGVGKSKANALLSLVIFLHYRKLSIHDLPLGSDLYDSMVRRCKSNNYQGEWRLLSQLLQIENSFTFSDYWILENFNQREIYGNIIPTGERFFNELNISLTAYPITKTKRKRGYKDKGSRKLPHEHHELTETQTTIQVTKEIEPLSGRRGLVNFLYGITAPTIIVEKESQSEIDYRKKINLQRNKQNRSETKRIKSLTGIVKVTKIET